MTAPSRQGRARGGSEPELKSRAARGFLWGLLNNGTVQGAVFVQTAAQTVYATFRGLVFKIALAALIVLALAGVGVFFITPCPAKMTAITSPLGQEKSNVSSAISMMEIYGLLRPLISKIQKEEKQEGTSTSYGIGWATSSGETQSIFQENALCVDGIQNCIRVLEEIENNKLSDLTFFEGNACTGGCVGGPLTFENNYVAKNSIRKLVAAARARNDATPQQSVSASDLNKYPMRLDVPIEPNSAMKLDDNITVAMQKLQRMNEIIATLPGYDCGSCGSPTCRSFAEDIVLGYANEMECIHKMRDKLQTMAEQMVELAQTRR